MEREELLVLGMKRRDLPVGTAEVKTDGGTPRLHNMKSGRYNYRSSGEPVCMPSLRYQAFNARVGIAVLIRWMMVWRVRVNPSGPSRSPCCTSPQL